MTNKNSKPSFIFYNMKELGLIKLGSSNFTPNLDGDGWMRENEWVQFSLWLFNTIEGKLLIGGKPFF